MSKSHKYPPKKLLNIKEHVAHDNSKLKVQHAIIKNKEPRLSIFNIFRKKKEEDNDKNLLSNLEETIAKKNTRKGT